MNRIELLSPAGDMNKLKTAFYFGADAVYIGGKHFSLRALAGNFTDEEIVEAVEFAHSLNKKVYVTVNIFGRNDDISKAEEYFKFLESAKVDGAIVSDTGLIYLARQVAPNLSINLSTQANTLNYKTVEFWQGQGLKRVILARELSLDEIAEIKNKVPEMEIETFIHGTMCISYSGRCLLSNYFNGRDANRGECVPACRWHYEIREKTKEGDFYPIEEDDRGTYILISKDLNMMEHIGDMIKAGIVSFKIEGRMKSEYYLATVINAYRRAIDEYVKIGDDYSKNSMFYDELLKTNHRVFTTAYMFGDNEKTVNYTDTQSTGNRQFIANVIGDGNGEYFTVQMRNRFKKGDVLEVLSPSENFNKTFVVDKVTDEEGNEVEDAKIVQQTLRVYSNLMLKAGDILRR